MALERSTGAFCALVCVTMLSTLTVNAGAGAGAATRAGQPASTGSEWRFDFGSGTSPVAGGYVRVANTTLYDSDAGYGLDRVTDFRDRGQPDEIRRDFTNGDEYGFAVEVPDGKYRVTVVSGDWIAVNRTTVSVEGGPEETIAADTGEFAEWTAEPTVTDGRMNFTFGRDGRVNAIRITQLFPPAGLHVETKTVTPESVTLEWQPAEGARSYNVYRAAAGGEFARIGTTTAARHTDDSGELELGLEYVYAVTQVTADGRESDRSESVTATIADESVPAPGTPAGIEVRADEQRDTYTLRWQAIDTALMYYVYRAEAAGGPFTRTAVAEGAHHTIDVAPSTGCCYRYLYRVVAVGEGGLSAPSETVRVKEMVEPNVVVEFDTSAAGGGARPLIGDVTGDGRPDVVMMQPHYKGSDQHEGALVAALTAYDINGDLLWQAGEVDPRGENNGSDIPAQIYDLDNDGRNEVVAIMHPGGDTSAEGRFMIFDGRTGELERDFALPHPEAHDAIIFANLTGTDTPQDILLKDRYNRVWAVDSEGELLWKHTGNTGHYPWPYDFDEDGRQAVMIGYDLVGPDGEVLWSVDLPAHADTMWMADVNADGETDIVLGGAGTTALQWDTGEVIWQNDDTVESQNVMVGDYLPDLPGLETLGLDRIDRSANGYDGLFLLDRNGELVWKERRETRGCWGSIPEPIHNWMGDYNDLIMVWNRGCGEPTGIMNGAGDLVTELDYEARLWHADFCGDDKEEVIEYIQGESVRIVSNGPCDLDAKVTGHPRPQAKRLYNYTRYTAGETPVLLSSGASARASSEQGEQGAHVAARATDGTDDRGWRAARKGAGEWIQIDLGRQYTLTGLELVMEQSRIGRYHGKGSIEYRVEVSPDGQQWSTATEARIDLTTGEGKQLFTAQGRYVRLTFTELPDVPSARAGVAEVGIFGNR